MDSVIYRVRRLAKDEPEAGHDNFELFFDKEDDAEAYVERNSSPDNPYKYVQDEVVNDLEFRKSRLA